MSQHIRQDFESGSCNLQQNGDSLALSSAFEMDPERLDQANKLYISQRESYDGRIESLSLDNILPPSNTQVQGLIEGISDEKSLDSGYIDALTLKSEESSKSSIPPSVAARLGDLGYGSLTSADYSSIGSYLSDDISLPTDTSSTVGSSVIMRDKSRAHYNRPSSDITSSTSSLSLGIRSESFHEHSSRQKLLLYAKKMNFTESEFEQSMAELGDDVDRDKLLGHLVKMRDSKQNSSTKSSQKISPLTFPAVPPSNQTAGDSKGLRRIVIDGSNIAMEHGLHQIYSCRGIEIAVKYFQERGHESITVFVPAHRLRNEKHRTRDQHILKDLSRRGVVVKTPSRTSSKGNIASYEDRFILKLASSGEAVVVSNDHFRDLKNESLAFRETIEKRILPFVFANDQFIPAEDPLGKRGPTLEQFLRVDPHNATSGRCPYGRKCTYGTKCKFGHPEREENYDSALGDSVKSIASSTSNSINTSIENNLSGVSLPGSTQQEFWVNRCGPISGQSMNTYVPTTQFPFVVTSAANHPQVFNKPPNYLLPVESAAYTESRRLPAEYPPVELVNPSLASRACFHTSARDESYLSVPLEDFGYCSKQQVFEPITTRQQPAKVKSRAQEVTTDVQEAMSGPQNVISQTQDVTSLEQYSTSNSSTPMPLNENILVSSSQHPPIMSEGRLPTSPKARIQPLNKPITESDPRYKMYYHLKNLFSEPVVRRVMNKYPNETDPNKITAEVLRRQTGCIKVSNIPC